jgi:hypothetical protein
MTQEIQFQLIPRSRKPENIPVSDREHEESDDTGYLSH